MSQMEYKTVLRGEIPLLEGMNMTNALAYFKEFLGEPEDMDMDTDDNEIYWFQYDGEFKPVHNSNQKKWGLDLIIYHRINYDTRIETEYSYGISLNDFNTLIDKLVNKCKHINKDSIKLISYDWYNGGDEPINF